MADVRSFAKRINKTQTPGEVRTEVASLTESISKQNISTKPGDRNSLHSTNSTGSNGSGNTTVVGGSLYSSGGVSTIASVSGISNSTSNPSLSTMGTTITSASASSSSSSLSTSSSSAAGGSGGGLAGSGSASSMVAPAVQIDFEELLTSRSKEIDSDKLKSILLVPADDISAQQKPREFRTVRSPVPVDYKATSADPVVSACVEAYVTDWNVIANKYSGYSKKQEKSDDSPPLNLPERSYEVDEKEKSLNGGGFGSSSNNSSPNASSMSLTIPSQFLEDNNSPSSSRSASPAPGQSPRPGDRSSRLGTSADMIKFEFAKLEPDTPQLDLLKYTPKETDAANARARQLDRTRLFSIQQEFDPAQERQRYSNDRLEAEPVFEKFGTRFLFTPKELTFKLEDVEPFFCSAALYDSNERKKISENFYFELNKPDVLQMLVPSTSASSKDLATEAKRAIFSVSEPHPEVYLVIRIEKVLQGDIALCAEPYLSSSVDKNAAKARQAAQAVCQRLGEYRMPFAWTATPLFNSKGELDSNEDMTLKVLFRQEPEKLSDDDLFKYLAEFRKGTIQRKLKNIPGQISFSTATFEETPPCTLTSSLVPVYPFPNVASDVAREIEEFPVHAIQAAHATFTHNFYVYPMSLNFTNRGATVKARNIACKIELLETDSSAPVPLRVIYGKPPGNAFISSVITSVTYHNKSPDFYEEVKIALPTKLTERHHLLFTFYHVSCQPPKKPGSSEPVDTVVGYSFFPLLRSDGRIAVTNELMLPVSASLVPNYLSDSPELKWVDGKRPLFKIGTKLASTVYAQSPEIHNFLSLSRSPNATEDSILGSIRHLLRAEEADAVQFTPVLLNQLFKILVGPLSSDAVAKETFRALIHIVTVNHKDTPTTGDGRNQSLHSYVQLSFQVDDNAKKLIHEEIIRLWIPVIKEGDSSATDLLKHSWFFFDICVKSALQSLLSKKGLQKPRADRLPLNFTLNIRTLMDLLTMEIQKRSKLGHTIAKRLNQAVGYFLRDCLGFMDRGFIFSLIHRHADETKPNDSEVLLEFKLEFLRIICNYEHYVALNLPLVPKAYSDKMLTLSEEFCDRHFLAGLILRELAITLEHTEKTLRKRAIFMVRDLLAKFDSDDRYNDKEARARIAGLHFPLISIILENHKRLAINDGLSEKQLEGTESKSNNNTLSDAQAQAAQKELSGTSGRSSSLANALASPASVTQSGDGFDFEESRELLLCFLHILNDANPELVRFWWRSNKDFPSVLQSFFDVLEKSIMLFEYVGKRRLLARASTTTSVNTNDTKRLLEETYSSLSTRSQRSVRVRPSASDITSSPTSGRDSSLRRFGQSLKRMVSDMSKSTVTRDIDHDARVEANLALEVALSVLDKTEEFINVLEDVLNSDDGQELIERIFRLLLAFLKTNQERSMSLHIFSSFRSFLFKFPELFFQGVTDYCAELVSEVLKQCNSLFTSSRTQATAFFYLLMKKNTQLTGTSFARVKVQSTIALSKIVGSRATVYDVFLQKSLATCSEYAAQDKEMSNSTFVEQVKDLTARLYTILRDTVKMKSHEKDSDMLIDLQYRLAKGYANSPDLRVTWLDNMANFHFEKKNWAEAAQCVIHTAALVAEYLNMLEYKKGLPQGCAAFQNISPNILEETAISEDAQSADEEGICESKSFSEAGLVALIEKAILFLKKAEYYETVNESYKLLLPILEKNRAFDKLADAHDKLKDIFTTIVSVTQSGKRILGSYFRVGFYGEKFGEENGKEYIYKEPKITPLAEISLRLQALYKEKFGDKNFELINDSTDVDVNKLDPAKAYIQLTYVEPYFTEFELKDRITNFERNNNINKFIFDTPFTESGKARGSVEDQRKRKTILTTEAYFPYLKRRLLVVDRHVVVLSPIEVAIEEIQSKTNELANVVQTKPTNVKLLQLVLQGSVSVTVNSGPLEMASVFLGKLVKDMPTKHVRKLKQQFREFVKYCNLALNLNSELIKPDQVEYQKDLSLKFKDLKAKLTPYIALEKASLTNYGVTELDGQEDTGEQINKVLNIIGNR